MDIGRNIMTFEISIPVFIILVIVVSITVGLFVNHYMKVKTQRDKYKRDFLFGTPRVWIE